MTCPNPRPHGLNRHGTTLVIVFLILVNCVGKLRKHTAAIKETRFAINFDKGKQK
jgi:hypothetical protein